jgi:hypothetical protein
MQRQHNYHDLATLDDMERAIADARRLGYTGSARIAPWVFLAPRPNTYTFTQDLEVIEAAANRLPGPPTS